MWEVYLPATGKVYNDVEVSIDKSDNQIRLAEIVLYEISKRDYNDVFKRGYTDRNVLIIKRDGKEEFGGFIEDKSPQYSRNIVITCRGYEVLLMNKTTDRDKEYIEQYSDTSIKDLLDTYSQNVTYLSNSITRFTDDDGNDQKLSMRHNHETLLRAVDNWCRETKQHWKVERLDTNTYILYIEDIIGSTEVVKILSSLTGAIVLSDGGSIMDVVNLIKILGRGDGVNKATVVLPLYPYNVSGYPDYGDYVAGQLCAGTDANRDASNGSYPPKCQPYPTSCDGTWCYHRDAFESQTKYGIIEGEPYSDQSLLPVLNIDSRGIIQVGSKILDESKEPKRRISVMQPLPSFSPNLGDDIRVVDDRLEIDTQQEVKTITWTSHRNRGDSIQLDLANKLEDEFDDLIEIKRADFGSRVHGQGATNIWQFGYAIDATNSKPMKLKFYMPNDVVEINSLILSLGVEPLRYYGETTQGESTHTHGISGEATDDGVTGHSMDLRAIGNSDPYDPLLSPNVYPVAAKYGDFKSHTFWGYIYGHVDAYGGNHTWRLYRWTGSTWSEVANSTVKVDEEIGIFFELWTTTTNYIGVAFRLDVDTYSPPPIPIALLQLSVKTYGTHTHGITGVATGGGSEHIHTIVPDVYEGDAPSAGGVITLSWDGSYSESYDSSGFSLKDIISGSKPSVGSIHTITITPAAGQKHFLTGLGSIQVYIESK